MILDPHTTLMSPVKAVSAKTAALIRHVFA